MVRHFYMKLSMGIVWVFEAYAKFHFKMLVSWMGIFDSPSIFKWLLIMFHVLCCFLCCSIRGYQSLVDIIVCTPGRLVDHINKTPGFDLTHLRFLVSRIDKFFTHSFWKHTNIRCLLVPVCLFGGKKINTTFLH